MGLLNHVLVPCVFPGYPAVGPGSFAFGFTTSPGTSIIAVTCTPSTFETQPWDGISRFTLDNGEALQGIMGTTPQLSDPASLGCTNCGTPPNTLDNNSLQGVNIYWIPSGIGGATALQSLVASTNFDMWIYEVSGITGPPVTNGYSNALDNFHGGPPVSSISTGIVDGGSSAFYVAGCGLADTTITVNPPWTLDQTDFGGTYMCFGWEMDTTAAYLTGSGPQNCTFSISDGPINSYNVGVFNAVIVAFPLGSACGGGAQAVGNPLTKGTAHSVHI